MIDIESHDQPNKGMVILLSTLILGSISPAIASKPAWYLMARHGECFTVDTLKRKVPDLGDINDPHTFAVFMRQKGYLVTTEDIKSIRGKAVSVKVSGLDLALIFISPELCATPEEHR